jgi:hypothetical protein
MRPAVLELLEHGEAVVDDLIAAKGCAIIEAVSLLRTAALAGPRQPSM